MRTKRLELEASTKRMHAAKSMVEAKEARNKLFLSIDPPSNLNKENWG
jgi:hypothetical protein